MRQAKKIGIALAIVVATGTLGLSAPAQASVFTIEWNGLITKGYDDTGVFNLHTDDLSGQTILVKVRVDTKTPGAMYDLDENGKIDGLYGFGSASPVSAWITINGVTRELLRDHEVYTPSSSDVIEHNDPLRVAGATNEMSFPKDQIYQLISRTLNLHVIGEAGDEVANVENDFLNLQMRGYPESDFADGDLETAPLSHVLTENERLEGDNVGDFKIFDDFQTRFSGVTTIEAYDAAAAQFDIVSFTVTADGSGQPPAVPEPGTWALMIAGLGLVGFMLRGSRRQRRADRFA
jgi:hypothetical protein